MSAYNIRFGFRYTKSIIQCDWCEERKEGDDVDYDQEEHGFMLIGSPAFPKLHLARGRGRSCRNLRSATQEMEIMYELRIAPTVRETIALNATEEPRLIRDSRQVTIKETRTALSGMSHPGRT